MELIKSAQRYGYLGKIPDHTFGTPTGVFTSSEHLATRLRVGASGAAIGYREDGVDNAYGDFTWLKAGESKSITGFPLIIIYLPIAASGAISQYVSFIPSGNFNGYNTYTIDGNDNFAFSQNIAGNYGSYEWDLFSISYSTDYFAPQYALLAGKFTRFATYGGTISLV